MVLRIVCCCCFFWSGCAAVISVAGVSAPGVSELLYIFIESSLISAGGGELRTLLQNLRPSAPQKEPVYQTHARPNHRLRPAKPTRRCEFLTEALIRVPLGSPTSQYMFCTCRGDPRFLPKHAFIRSEREFRHKTNIIT